MSEVIGIGAAPRRKEDLRFMTGRGNYVADIERPGMVFGVFVRSPHAHARINSIDPGAAVAMPGVLSVFTRKSLQVPGESHGHPRSADLAQCGDACIPAFVPLNSSCRALAVQPSGTA
jgi:CO/xanthine dehydrogenase Mo-binding subunit